jgi:transcriptional regulator with XRE-family HTH domain
MDGVEFKTIREQLGLTKNQFATMIGYTGTSSNNTITISRYESGKRQVPLYIARFVWLLGQLDAIRHNSGVPIPFDSETGLVRFPHWPGYVFDSAPDEIVDDEDEDEIERVRRANNMRKAIGSALDRSGVVLSSNTLKVVTEAAIGDMERTIKKEVP